MKVEINGTVSVLRELSVKYNSKGVLQLSERATGDGRFDDGSAIPNLQAGEELIVIEKAGSGYWMCEHPLGYQVRVCKTHIDADDNYNKNKASAKRTEQTPQEKLAQAKRQAEYAKKLLAEADAAAEAAEVQLIVDEQIEATSDEDGDFDARQEAEEMFAEG